MRSSDRSAHPLAFLFTDLESSTRLWEEFPDAMRAAIVRHDEILDRLIVEHGGRVVDHAGDGAFAVFASDTDGADPLGCAIAVQRALQDEPWEGIPGLRARLAVHAGRIASDPDGDYRGQAANRAARIMAAGWGGQILVTPEALASFPLPEGARTEERGEHLLKDLTAPQALLELLHPELTLQGFPELRSLSSFPNNLPTQSSTFIGRDKELEQLREMLADPQRRLLTVIGPGGIGKTRIALQTAVDRIEQFSGGTYFVPLAALDSPDLVIPAIADAIGLNFYTHEEPKIQLLRYLEGREMLLVLDNFEHLIDAAEMIPELLDGASKLKILVTSRERLNLRGELTYGLDGLLFPPPGHDHPESFDAFRLFLERVRLRNPSFEPTEDDHRHIAVLCHLVEGIPLALELAAAWVPLLPCEEVVEEIRQSLDFLDASLRDIPQRHRNLRAVFEYSWALILKEEKIAFQSLSVFKNGFSRRAARQVAQVSLHHLRALTDKSLIKQTGRDRFTVHELLRQFGEEKLRDDNAHYGDIRGRHCDYYTRFLGERRAALRGDHLKQTLEEIHEELENLRFAWTWALEQGNLAALDRAVEEWIIFFEVRSRLLEGDVHFRATAEHLEKIAAPTPEDEILRARLLAMVLGAMGLFRVYMARYGEADHAARRALEALAPHDLPMEKGYCRYVMSCVHQGQGRYDAAEEEILAGIAELEKVEDPYRLINARGNLGNLYSWLGRFEEARALYEETVESCGRIGNTWVARICQMLLAELLIERGEHEKARGYYESSLTYFRDLGDLRWAAYCLAGLTRLFLASGNTTRGREAAQEGLRIADEIHDLRKQTECLTLLARLESQAGAPEAAQRLLLDALGRGATDRTTPEMLEALLALVEAERFPDPERAAEILHRALNHPALKRNAGTYGERLLTERTGRLAAEAVAAARRRGEALDPADLVRQILAGPEIA